MELYIIIYICLLLGIFIPQFERNSAYVYLCMLFFSFIIGYRGQYVGDDTSNYISIYNAVANDSYDGSTELLYLYACRFFSFLGFPFQFFQMILIFIALCFTARGIRHISPYFNLSIFLLFSLYYIFYAMNIYREMLACFMIVNSYPLLYTTPKRYRMKYVALVLFAACFHLSALVMLPLLFIHKVRMSFLFAFLTIAFSLVLGMLMSMENLAFLMGKYQQIMYESGNERPDVMKSLFLAFYWIFEFVFLYFISNESDRKSTFMKIMLLSVVVNNLLIQQAYGLRVFIYFNLLQILFIPVVIKNCRFKSGFIRLLFIIYLSIYIFVFLSINSASVVPYELNI